MTLGHRTPRLRAILASKAWPTCALIAGALLYSFRAGREVASGSQALPLVTIGLLAAAMLLKNPIWGFYLTYPLFFLVPYAVLRLDLPFFNGPADVVSSLTLGIALARFVVQRRRLPSSALYAPMAVCAGLLAIFAAIGHGPDTGWYLNRFVQGPWPFYLVILLVETPRQARNVLLALFVSVMTYVLRFLPTLLSTSRAALQTGALLSLARGMTGAWMTFQVIALALIPLFALALFSEQPRLRYLCGSIAVVGAFVVVGGTYLAAMLTLLIGIVAVLLLAARQGWTPWRMSRMLLIVAVMAVTLRSPPGQFLLDRLLHPWEDLNISTRLGFSWIEGLRAFLERPLVGWGGHLRSYVTPGGNVLDGHSSFITAAYSFGLVFLAPLFLLFWQVAQNFRRLLARPLARAEKALLVGTLAVLVAYLIIGVIAGTLFEASQDCVLWSFVGLTVVWRDWLSQGSQSRIVA